MEQEWISLNEFMRRNHIGYETATKLINSGKIEYEKLNGQYKVRVTKNEQADKEKEYLIKRVQELETIVKTLQNIIKQVKI